MRIVRPLFVLVAALLVVGGAAPADASVGPRPYQLFATAQSRQVMAHLTSSFDQLSSPPSCAGAAVFHGALLLPTLAGRAGDRTFSCTTTARAVLVDLGGFVCSEDTDPDDVYTTVDGRQLRFSHGNLEAICGDVIRFVTPAIPVLDGHPIRHHRVAVGTAEFLGRVRPSTGAYWDTSVTLGHPGTLWAAYGGYKQLLPLDTGHHTVVTDLSTVIGAPAVLTFEVDVRGTV